MGNQVVYTGEAGTKTASLDRCKLMMNRVTSRKGSKFITYNVTTIPPESNSPNFSITLQVFNMWAYVYNGSLWVHTNATVADVVGDELGSFA